MGRYRLELIRHLAIEDLGSAKLAKKYGVGTNAISMFKKRHKREIMEFRSNLDDEYVGLWIATKRDRIAELQEMADILGEAIASLVEAGQVDTDLMKARAGFLKQVSEELGQLPPRQQVVSAQVTHIVQGVSADELKAALT
jgi:hypothetical protein